MTLNDIPYEGLNGAEPVKPMSKDESELFIKLCFREMEPRPDSPTIEAKMRECPFTATVIMRLETSVESWRDVISEAALLMLGSLETSCGFGHAVLWAYTALYWRAESGEPVTMSRLALYFPAGFPTEEAISAVWRSQKVRRFPGEPQSAGIGSDNMLDRAGWWRALAVLISSGKKGEPS